MDHKIDLLQDPIMKNHIQSLVKVIQDEMELKYHEDQILHAFGVLRINSFGVDTPEGGHGRGLFPLLGIQFIWWDPEMGFKLSKELISVFAF